MDKIINFFAFCAILCALFFLGNAEPAAEKTDCDDCKFFPNVCYHIDECIADCNIAPSMKQNCEQFIKEANAANERNENL